jgi:hypothetical protein
MGPPASGGDQVDEMLPIVGAITDDRGGSGQAIQECRRGRLVGSLSRCQQEFDGQSVAVDNGVEFGAQSATRTADGVIRAPFLPPAAC